MLDIVNLKAKIEENNKILILGHISPDGDAVGSGLALMLGLKNKYPNKKIEFILEDNVPKNITFLNEIDKIQQSKNVTAWNFDIVIFVDSANMDRVGKISDYVKNIFKINIDHHISNTNYGDINIVEEISSTSELMYSIIKKLEIDINKNIAEALYLGIMTDTGNFSHSNVTSKTFETASELVKKGADSNKIATYFFKNESIKKLRLYGKVFSEMIEIPEKKFTYFYLSKKCMEELGVIKEDTDGIVDRLLSSENSSVSLFLREDDDGIIKGSLRSKYDIDVNIIANIFGGGGHIKAAGFTSNIFYKKIIKIVEENL